MSAAPVIVPANEASWDDLTAIFGAADYSGRCRCQRFKIPGWLWRDSTTEERAALLSSLGSLVWGCAAIVIRVRHDADARRGQVWSHLRGSGTG